MPIINVDEADKFEDKPVPEGPYDLRIVKAEKKDSKKGKPMIVVTMKIEGEEEAALVNEYLVVPSEGDEHYRMQMRNISRFCALFGVDNLDTDDPDSIASLQGQTANCYLTLEARKDESGNATGDEQNRLRLPRIGK